MTVLPELRFNRSWRVANSLLVLLAEVNARASQRSKLSDGGIGDPAHAGRDSDHNPFIKDTNGVGVVRAYDFTDDPVGGHDDREFLAFLVALGKDGFPPIADRYVIGNGTYASQSTNWLLRPYTGVNSHKKHTHVSVSKTQNKYDYPGPWGWANTGGIIVPVTQGVDMIRPQETGNHVTVMQWRLNEALHGDSLSPKGLKPDGVFGASTEKVVREMQTGFGYVSTGVYDLVLSERVWELINDRRYNG